MLTWIIVMLSLIFFIDLGVSILNYRYRHTPIPEIAKGIYDQEKYQKWLHYFMVNHRFSLITKSFDFILLIVLLTSGFFPSIINLSEQWAANELIGSLLFLGIYVVIDLVVGLPFQIYQTFHIETTFGFNRTSIKQFVIDKIKSLLLTVILGGAIVSLLWALYTYLGAWFILAAWVTLSILMILLFILNTKVFVRLFNKLTPLEDGELKTKITLLSSQVGFQIQNISIMDASKRSTKLNAFFSGFGKFKDVVLFDTLVDAMSIDQILAVLAHELGHSKHRDTLRTLIFQVMLFGIYALILFEVLQNQMLFDAFGLSTPHFGFSLILFFILLSPVNLIVSMPMNYLARVAEYKADHLGALLVSREAMEGALKVLAKENLANLTPHPWYIYLHYNHPSIPDRLLALARIQSK